MQKVHHPPSIYCGGLAEQMVINVYDDRLVGKELRVHPKHLQRYDASKTQMAD